MRLIALNEAPRTKHCIIDRINRIANEASRVKIDYDSKYAFKLKLAAEK